MDIQKYNVNQHLIEKTLLAWVKSGEIAITVIHDLHENLKENCIPQSIFTMTIEDYDEFLVERRKLMAEKIKNYYYSL